MEPDTIERKELPGYLSNTNYRNKIRTATDDTSFGLYMTKKIHERFLETIDRSRKQGNFGALSKGLLVSKYMAAITDKNIRTK